MFVKSDGKFGNCAVWQERPEPARADPRADRIFVAEVLKQTRWTVDDLNFAIDGSAFPKPIGYDLEGASGRTPIYSRKQIARWRERITTDLKRLGFSATKSLR